MDKFNQLFNFLNRIIDKLADQKISFQAWLISFLAIVFLRNFLESFSGISNLTLQKNWAFFFLHSGACYLFGILIYIIIGYFFTGERIEKISKLALFGVFLILIPPVLELIISQGQGGLVVRYGDLSAWSGNIDLKNWIQLFVDWIIRGPFGLLFFGSSDYPLQHLSYNFGTRINVLIILWVSLVALFLRTKSYWKILLSLALFYCFSFFFCLFPYILGNLSGVDYRFSSFNGRVFFNESFGWDLILFSGYFVLIIFLAVVWFFIYDRKKFMAILKNIRFFRLLHNLAMLGLGFYLARPDWGSLGFFDGLYILVAVLALVFYWLSALGYDDLHDEEIDKISNSDRPLPQGSISRQDLSLLNNLFLGLAYLCAFVAGYSFFVLLFLRSMLLFIYSGWPLRLKRFPLIATGILSLAAVLTVLAGFVLGGGDIVDFPRKLMFFIFLAFTLGFMAKDIKDFEGDKKEKVYTIPVILGIRNGKLLIGFLAALIFLAVLWIFPENFKILLWPSLLAAVLSFIFINKNKYSEMPLLLIYFFYGLFFVLAVL